MSDRVRMDKENARTSACACGKGWCYLEKAPRHVLFLDFDGVLNSSNGWKRDEPQTYMYVTPECVEQLGRILGTVPDLMVCVSSTWRRYHSVDELGEFLSQLEIPRHRIISRTPMRFSEGVRGHEIQDWLDEHPGVERFCIVDDDADMAHLMDQFVQTDHYVGLTKEKAGEIIQRFS
jgi:hypothetical protein